MKRLFSAFALTLITVLSLAACGTGSSGGSNGDFNDADVTFAQEMIPHHKQAVEMAQMARTNAEASQVKNLAAEIDAAQGPELETMQGWLKSWDKSEDLMSDHSGMAGMMSSDDMRALQQAKGAAFDEMFLTMMIAHHEGAIEMAKAEQIDGQNADAKALAEDIERAQTSEIAEMKALLGS